MPTLISPEDEQPAEQKRPSMLGIAISPRTLLPAAAALAVSAVAAICCFRAAGATAGLFFGPIAFAVLIVPPMVLTAVRPKTQAIIAAGALAGTAAVWMGALSDPYLGIAHWASCVLVLAAWVVFLWGLAVVLARLHLPAPIPVFLVVLIAAAWLTWPIWLSPWLAGRDALVGWLTPAHPLLAIDGALTALGPPWSERPLMYNRLSILNQDVPYELPSSVTWTVLLHGIIGAIFLSVPASARK